jgi:hypothetical protein
LLSPLFSHDADRTERRILTDPFHRLHHVVVLGVVRAAPFVPHEVVRDHLLPTALVLVSVAVIGPHVHRLVVVGLH